MTKIIWRPPNELQSKITLTSFRCLIWKIKPKLTAQTTWLLVVICCSQATQSIVLLADRLTLKTMASSKSSLIRIWLRLSSTIHAICRIKCIWKLTFRQTKIWNQFRKGKMTTNRKISFLLTCSICTIWLWTKSWIQEIIIIIKEAIKSTNLRKRWAWLTQSATLRGKRL